MSEGHAEAPPPVGEDVEDEESRAKTFVREAPEIVALVQKIANPDADPAAVDSANKQLDIMLDKYLEQPTLLDGHLNDLVKPLMLCTRRDHPRLHQACHAVYTLCRVRGHKTIVKFFPHDVADVEPTLELLADLQHQSSQTTWQTEYVLLVWMSILVLVPFDLTSLDSAMSKGDSHSPLIAKLIGVCKGYLDSPGIGKDGAALVLGRLLTRPDMSSGLQAFLDWGTTQLSQDVSDVKQQLLATGVLMALTRIFKHGKRNEVLPYTDGLIAFIVELQQKSGDHVETKLCTKVVQRIALLHLPPRVAAWRYQRGMRSLEGNLKSAQQLGRQGHEAGSAKEDDEEEEIEIPECLEEVLDFLLSSLNARDTTTRWSAAKGIGRITSRLPRSLADEVVTSVLEAIEEEQSDTAWHGSCLAIAEMARRGVLLPSRLPDAMPVVVKALHYEKRRGAHSVGSHVRDSACYVCWAFARAYAPDVLKPHVLPMAQALLVTACYDREVNCRRAASAAFQENVGRQGTFPHGIEIVQRADYFNLGNRAHAYTDVSLFIAQFEEYRPSLVKHLVDCKLNNWDKAVRELASKTLFLLSKLDPSHLATTALPELLPRVSAMEPLEREGVILAISEIILGVSEAGYDLAHHEASLTKIQQMIALIQKKRLFRGRGGEYVRTAVSRFVECIGLSPVPFPADSLTKAIALLEENLKNPQEYIQDAAMVAYDALARRFFASAEGQQNLLDSLTTQYIKLANDRLPSLSRGFSGVLGKLTPAMLRPHLSSALRALSKSVEVQLSAEQRDPETRRNAIAAIVSVATRVGQEFPSDLTDAHIRIVTGSLVLALDDHCTDNRGDVGSWVRLVALTAAENWIRFLCKRHEDGQPFPLAQITCVRLFGGVLRQLTGRLDRLRTKSAAVLCRIWGGDMQAFCNQLPHNDSLASLFRVNEEQIGEVWGVEAVLSRVGPVLGMDEYRLYALEGWATCTDLVNGFKRSQLSVHALVEWATSFMEGNRPTVVASMLLDLAKMGRRRNCPPRGADPSPIRLAASAVSTLAKFLESLSLESLETLRLQPMPNLVVNPPPPNGAPKGPNGPAAHDDADWNWVATDGACHCDSAWREGAEMVDATMGDVLERVVAMVLTKRTVRDFGTVVQAMHVTCALVLAQGRVGQEALRGVLDFLTDHPWPRIRKVTADQLYLHLLSAKNLQSKSEDDICDLVVSTSWVSPLEETDLQRTKLYAAFGVDVPERIPVEDDKPPEEAVGEDLSYADLINDIARGVIG